MTGSEHDLATLMAEVDVPLEDMPESCENLTEHAVQASANERLAPLVPHSSGASPDDASPTTTGTQTSNSPSLPPLSASAPSAAKPSHAPLSSNAPSTSAVAAPSRPHFHPPAPQSVVPTSSKSKKKKSSASAAAALMGLSKEAVDKGENVGRWTAEEHRLFLQGLEQHGKGWKKIASLIKTRSVVQIRTHAQKYFQKLAKARQNGEEGDVTMEGRGGISSAASLSTIVAAHANKRRRPTTGTKRKVIQSIVGSAIRHGKKLAAAQAESGYPDSLPPLPAVAPILAHFIVPNLVSSSSSDGENGGIDPPATGGTSGCIPSISTSQGIISGPSLEDSIFRFLTPAPVAGSAEPHVSDIARQAGANPITLPSSDLALSSSPGMMEGDGGEISPTSIADMNIYPSWTDAKDTPSWYAKGADVDVLLEVGEALDWLADTGDLNETYQPPPIEESTTGINDLPEIDDSANTVRSIQLLESCPGNNTSVATLPHVDSNVGSVIPPLPSLFDGAEQKKPEKSQLLVSSASDIQLKVSPSATALDGDHLQVFENPMEEQEFVSTILETE